MEKEIPLVSIVTVTYNAERDIEACINSVKRQSYPNIEHIIIDGGSTDHTLDIVKKSKVELWISEPDQGIYDAMNKSIQFAKGKWILFLGADDILLDDFSKLCYRLKDDNHIYYAQSQFNNKLLGCKFNAYRLAKFNICHQSMLYPKKVFDFYQYNLKYKVRADHELNIRCFADPRFKFEYHPLVISKFADGGFSSTFDDTKFFNDRDEIIKHNLGKLVYLLFKIRRLRHKIKGRKS